MKYLRCNVFMSAMNYFKELEMWDEVVTCYQLMSKPQRAEMVVRERLKHGQSPYMLTSLADLTGKEEYYEQAWDLSNGRYPRAKRTLGKLCHDRGDYADAIRHLEQALNVQPLVATAWYLKGISCMRLERWEEAVGAFVRCVQQDTDMPEAWNNIGAIHMQLKDWNKAYPAFQEAIRQASHDNWKVQENMMCVCIQLGKWREVARVMSKLLDLRGKSERPLHMDQLRHLAYITSMLAQKEARLMLKDQKKQQLSTCATATSRSVLFNMLEEDCSGQITVSEEDDGDVNMIEVDPLFQLRVDEERKVAEEMKLPLRPVQSLLPEPALSTETLLARIVNTLPSEPEVWDCYADFQHALGRMHEALEARVKQFRALNKQPNWEKEAEKVTKMGEAAVQLVNSHRYKAVVKKADIYSCQSMLKSANSKVDAQLQLLSAHGDTWSEGEALSGLLKLLISTLHGTYAAFK